MNIRNITTHDKKYFYTVLYLNDYFPPSAPPPPVESELRVFDISADTNNSFVKWLSPTQLWVRHNLPLPVTLEMWDNEGDPIFYCPILKDDIDSLSVGEIVKESDFSLILNFSIDETTGEYKTKPPTGNEIYRLAIRSLPDFNLKQGKKLPPLPLDEQIQQNQTGLAIVFRRETLDALFDLIAEFDESYWHSLQETYDLQYLTQQSCYQNCYFARKIYIKSPRSIKFN